jgi:hypothetical protein
MGARQRRIPACWVKRQSPQRAPIVEPGRFTSYVLTEALIDVLRSSDVAAESIDIA